MPRAAQNAQNAQVAPENNVPAPAPAPAPAAPAPAAPVAEVPAPKVSKNKFIKEARDLFNKAEAAIKESNWAEALDFIEKGVVSTPEGTAKAEVQLRLRAARLRRLRTEGMTAPPPAPAPAPEITVHFSMNEGAHSTEAEGDDPLSDPIFDRFVTQEGTEAPVAEVEAAFDPNDEGILRRGVGIEVVEE